MRVWFLNLVLTRVLCSQHDCGRAEEEGQAEEEQEGGEAQGGREEEEAAAAECPGVYIYCFRSS